MQDRRTDSRTAGDTDSGNGLHRGQQEGRRTGQRETVTDRETGTEDTEHGDMDSRTGAGSGSVRGQRHWTTAERED